MPRRRRPPGPPRERPIDEVERAYVDDAERGAIDEAEFGDEAAGLVFSPPAVRIPASCAGCGVPVDLPEPGARHPMQDADRPGQLFVNGDGPCESCGTTRVRVRIEI